MGREIWVGNVEGKDRFKDLVLNGRLIFKGLFIWLRISTNGVVL
jgi:hypothetical protein